VVRGARCYAGAERFVIDVGSVVNGKYHLVRILGDGGMGSVYEAQHTVLGTRVAIKVLHQELARRTGLVERFLQEARVVAQIRSLHVVQVTDIDRTPDGHAYIVMELLEGEPLSSVIDRQRRIPVPVACEYTVQVLEALEAAHALGVVHRDLKPENVFVTFAGGRPVLKLIDFGIAKARRIDAAQRSLTVAGVVMGTAEYMAPEQARSADKVDPRADLYAVGVILYEMIAGTRPVRGDTGEDARVIALKVERGEVVPLVQAASETPRELAGLVHRAMAARPELRFATATEMRLALQAVMSARGPSTGARPAVVGSGTVAMVGGRPISTPVGKAFGAADRSTPSSSPSTGSGEREPAVDTVRAPPIATALAPAAYAGAAMPAIAPEEALATPRRRRVSWIALVSLSLLLVASVLGILVGTGTLASSSAPIAPVLAGPTSTSSAIAGPTAPANPAAPPSPPSAPAVVPTLTPAKPSPAPPRPAPSVRPSSGPDAGLPPSPFAFPTSLPPFPSAFPFPMGFPSALPSGFPSVFPGWPQLPPPSPAPKQAAPATPIEY
jgi:tRNA A-37 threonylcarbamoyl transferase component Bud32